MDMKKHPFRIALEMIMEEHKRAKEPKCPVCHGEGSYYMDGDLHKSGGVVPCGHWDKTGYCNKGKWVKRGH